MKRIYFCVGAGTLPALLFAVTCVYTANGHGLLSFPSSKNGGTLGVTDESAIIHFALASYGIIDKAFFEGDHSKTPWTRPGEFDHILARDLIEGHPETLHPCGCNAGDVVNCAGVVQASGFGETTLGGTVIPPTWVMGSVQETAWNAWANHAGGHIYMLCKKTDFDSCRDTILPDDPTYATREEKDAYLKCVWDCFESNTLEWAPQNNNQWSQKLQFQDDPCTYATMQPATKVGNDGHVWRFTPIPDTLQVTNGGEGQCMWDTLISFSNSKAREEFVASFGNENVCDWGDDAHTPYDWHIFDKVIVPTNLEEGEYLLSWRWDAYMADQMWTNCADVTIVASDTDSAPSISKLEDECPTQPPVEFPPTPSPQPVVNPPTVAPPNCPSGYTGLLPYNECTQYFQCQNGNVIGNLLDCPADTLFDVDLQYCNWDYLVTCESSPTPPPAVSPTKSPSVTPPTSPPLECPPEYRGLQSHNECTQYYHCQDGNVIGSIKDCPDGTLFDMENQYCNWDYLVTCESSPTSPPVLSPTKSPTPPEGCYSNNFKDCNHPHFQSEDSSCHTIWLPNGGRDTCIPLWGSCTDKNVVCCEPAICYQDDEVGPYAQCIPPNEDSTAPSASPSDAGSRVSSVLDPGSKVTLVGATNKKGGKFVDDGTTKKVAISKDNDASIDPGVQVVPSWSQSIVKGIRVYSANGQKSADPKSYKLEGRKGKGKTWVVISEGSLALGKGRNNGGIEIKSSFEKGDTSLSHDEVLFSNDEAYSHYRVTFPTVKGSKYVKVQMAEVELPGILVS